MKRLVPVFVLALAACAGPIQTAYPPQTMVFDRGNGLVLDVELQKDPFEGWTARIASVRHKIGADRRDEMIALVENEIGPKVCTDARPIAVEDEPLWHRQGRTVTHLPDLGVWLIVGQCEGAIEHL